MNGGRLPSAEGYEVQEVIGRGGFATVYRAVQPRLDREVALKVIHPGAHADDASRNRFERECRAIGSLTGHPSVVTVFDIGTTTDGDPYLSLEYLPGGSLQRHLDEIGALPWPDALRAGAAVAEGLAAAHELGILHRDVKPGNVLTDRFGNHKLGDFGIAGLASASGTTTGGATAMTVAYAAPEVLHGHRATAASDLYGLGALLYTLIAGSPAFAGKTDESIVPMILRVTTAELTPLPEDLAPAGVRLLVEDLMAKNPSDRPPSASAVARRLRSLASEPDAPRRSSSGTGEEVPRVLPSTSSSAELPQQPADPDIGDRAGPSPEDLATVMRTSEIQAVMSGTASAGVPPAGPGDPSPPDAGTMATNSGVGIDRKDPTGDTVVVRPAADGDSGSGSAGDTGGPSAPPPLATVPAGGHNNRRAAAVALLIAVAAVLTFFFTTGHDDAGAAVAACRAEAAKLQVAVDRWRADHPSAVSGPAVADLIGRQPSSETRSASIKWFSVTDGRIEPRAGTTLPPGCSAPTTGRAKVKVPSVIGLVPPSARDMLKRLGLHVVINPSRYDAKVARGRIANQDPKPGTLLPRSGTIHIVASLGPAPTAVQDFVGRNVFDAVTQLQRKGFVVTTKTDPSDQPAGTVIAIDPRPGTKLPKGAHIVLHISAGPPEPTTTVAVTRPAPATTEPYYPPDTTYYPPDTSFSYYPPDTTYYYPPDTGF